MHATWETRGSPRRWIERGVLLLTAAFALWALRRVEPGVIVPRLGAAGWGVVFVLFGASAVFTFLPSWIFLRRAGARVPFLGLSVVMLACHAVNATNPLRMGFPMRIYLLRERYGVPLATGSLLIPLEGFVAIAVAAFAAVAAAPLGIPSLRNAPRGALALAVLASSAAAIAAGRFATRRSGPILSRLPERASAAAQSLLGAAAHVRSAVLAAFAVCFLLVDLAVAGMLKVALHASGFDAPILYLLAAYCAAYLFGIASLIPQGLGTRDAALGLLLHAGGATPEQAASAVVVARAATSGLAFVAGIFSAFLLGLSRQTKGAPSRKTASTGARR